MRRAIVVAPAGVDLVEKLAEIEERDGVGDRAQDVLRRTDIVRIPGATNGTLQAWDTNNARLWEWLAGKYAQLDVYSRRRDVPNALLAHLIRVQRSDSRTAAVNVRWVRFADLSSTLYEWEGEQVRDWFRVRGTDGSIRVDVKANMTAGEKPVDWTAVHEWLGVADNLGEI